MLANRLLISVREKYYDAHGELEHSTDDDGSLSVSEMRFHTRPWRLSGVRGEDDERGGSTTLASRGWDVRTDATDSQEIEMDNFSETRGF